MGLQGTMRQLFDPLADARQLPETSLRRLRAAQLRAVLRLTPVLMAANVGLAAVVVAAHGRAELMLWAWAGAVLVLAVLGLRGWRRSRRRPVAEASARAISVLTRQSLLLGLVWGLLPPLLMRDGSLEAASLSIALVASSLSCGSFALVSAPGAALAYALPMATSICLCMGVSAHPILRVMSVLEVFFVALLEGLMLSQSRDFGTRLVSELKLQGQHDLLRHLLAEIEVDSTAWRWRTDTEGRLVELSDPALAGALGADAVGRSFAAVVTAAESISASASGLSQALDRRAPFHDVNVSRINDGQARWWSLSGKPVFDDFGRFTGFRGIGRDVTDQRAAEERIRYMARHDGLTGLANRMAFGETLTALGAEGSAAAVLALDLDRFKAVNDTLGHPAGDALLVQVANRLQAALPAGAVAARLGGDEFAALVVGVASPGELVSIADRLVAALAEPYDLDGQAASVGVSVGVATHVDAGEGVDALQRADLALYQAKLDGRGAARFFEARMAEEAHRQHSLEIDLRAALACGEFEVHYQPLVDSGTHEVTAFEALLRWDRPGFGLLSPAAFIDKCEQCGLIAQVGAWVLQVATREAAFWPADIRVAVNLSTVQFASGELLGVVRAALDASGLAPERLELEITESLLITNQAGVLEQLKALKAMGVRIALDDFGTGYSSLAYLWRFPFDKLKIDRSFVANLHTQEPVIDIVRTIAALGRTLQLSITAEGVETSEQATTLRGLACSELQGFYFSRPMPARDLAAYLLRNSQHRHSQLPATPNVRLISGG